MTGELPRVTVVIPTLNAGDQFEQLLESVKRQQSCGEIEIVVIDSHSQDRTPQRARSAGARVLSIPRRRFNHGRARNQAIQASGGEFIALTVQDARPTDEYWLARLIAPLEEQTDVAGSYGLQICPPTAGLLARTRSLLWQKASERPVVRALTSPREFEALSPQERLAWIRFDNVTACVRRGIWEKIPFPEQNYGEDMAWAREVLLAGYKVAHAPAAQVWHCHERGWGYELRRAYVDGFTRVQLVDWPSADLRLGDVWAILRRLIFFLTTRRFDPLVEPEVIRWFLKEELERYGPVDTRAGEIYVAALHFAQSLWHSAAQLCPAGALPAGAWSALLRFALVAVVGESLGSAASVTSRQPFSFERLVWHLLHQVLGKGI